MFKECDIGDIFDCHEIILCGFLWLSRNDYLPCIVALCSDPSDVFSLMKCQTIEGFLLCLICSKGAPSA